MAKYYYIHSNWDVVITDIPIKEDDPMDLNIRFELEDENEYNEYISDPAKFCLENDLIDNKEEWDG